MSDSGALMADVRSRHMLGLLRVQLVASVRQFARNRVAAFFTLVFPLVFLVVFNLLNGGVEMQGPSGAVSFAQFFAPGAAAFGIITACYISLAVSMVSQRDLGILKRVRGTPLPLWIYLAGCIGAAVLMSLASVVVTTAAGAAFSGVQIVWRTMGATVVAVVLGAVCFGALGLALAGAIPNAEAAPALAGVTIFPLLFISGVFFPLEGAPSWVIRVARFFPIEHLANSLQTDYTPQVVGSGFVWRDLAALSLWLLVGLALAIRYFRWDPQAVARRYRRGPRRPGDRRWVPGPQGDAR